MTTIDVLAVMDNFIDPQRHPHQPHDLAEARAAVAVLIAAAKYAEQDEYTHRSCVRLRAAIARVGGAA